MTNAIDDDNSGIKSVKKESESGRIVMEDGASYIQHGCQTSPRLPLVKVVDATIVMAASPTSSTCRRNESVKNVCETNTDSQFTSKQPSPTNGTQVKTAIGKSEPENDANSAMSCFSTSTADADETSSSHEGAQRRVSWPVRIVHFLRNFQRRVSKKSQSNDQNRQPCDHGSGCSSPTPSSNSVGTGRQRSGSSPFIPSMIVTKGDETESDGSIGTPRNEHRRNSKWSLHVEDFRCSSSNRIRKNSAGDIHAVEKTNVFHRKFISHSVVMAPEQEIADELTEYVVNVKTSDRFGAGTDARVFLQMFGEQGTSAVFPLSHSNNVNKFERNQLDRFVFRNVVPIGQLQSIKIWHDNTGVGAAWHLAYVEISDTGLGQMFRFPCHSWMAADGDSSGLSRELRCFEVVEGPKQAIQTAVGVSKSSLSDSVSSLNSKNVNSGSLPVTPTTYRKNSRAPLLRGLIIPKIEQVREFPVESVFTPAPTRPAPVIRLPMGDEEDYTDTAAARLLARVYRHSHTEPLFSSSTLAEAATRKLSMEGKRSVYGTMSTPYNNGHSMGQVRVSMSPVRRASMVSLSSTPGGQEAASVDS